MAREEVLRLEVGRGAASIPFPLSPLLDLRLCLVP